VVTEGGLFVSFEGIDKCGKSTQAHLLCEALVTRGVPVGSLQAPGEVVREPGGTAVGEAVRHVLLHAGVEIEPWTEALLYAAARAELVARVVRPALRAGRTMILDRFVDSSLAYQGWARDLGVDRVLSLNALATGGLLPHLTIVLDIDPASAVARAGGPQDRIEREGLAFQQLVADGYREVARRFPERVVVMDGAQAPSTIAALVLDRVDALLVNARV
jgi:dTMP kinase